MKTAYRLASASLVCIAVSAGAVPIWSAPPGSSGPLHADPQNPRYFTDNSGKAIYLTGAHTWNNFKDMGPSDPPELFNFEAYLDFLAQHQHNFIQRPACGLR